MSEKTYPKGLKITKPKPETTTKTTFYYLHDILANGQVIPYHELYIELREKVYEYCDLNKKNRPGDGTYTKWIHRFPVKHNKNDLAINVLILRFLNVKGAQIKGREWKPLGLSDLFVKEKMFKLPPVNITSIEKGLKKSSKKPRNAKKKTYDLLMKICGEGSFYKEDLHKSIFLDMMELTNEFYQLNYDKDTQKNYPVLFYHLPHIYLDTLYIRCLNINGFHYKSQTWKKITFEDFYNFSNFPKLPLIR